jgi:hypothetical protein
VHTFCIRPDDGATSSERSPCFGTYVQIECNCPDSRATLSECDLDMETREACYGKSVTRNTIQMLSASFRTTPREIRDRADLGLLIL